MSVLTRAVVNCNFFLFKRKFPCQHTETESLLLLYGMPATDM